MQVHRGQRSKVTLPNHILLQFQQGVSLNLEFSYLELDCLASESRQSALPLQRYHSTFGLNYPKSADECGGPTSDDHIVYEMMFLLRPCSKAGLCLMSTGVIGA